ncbi:hypothetical protein HZA55_00980 [Candidatus Poribacteria bacterium]|nr:hypothetical protein [Candidatus Poribacteria bacterium]
MTFKKIFIILIMLLPSYLSADGKKSKEEALIEFYAKYQKSSFPQWLKKICEKKGITVKRVIDEKEVSSVINFEELILMSNEKVQSKSYEDTLYRDLYIMAFEGGQKYLKDYFTSLNQIESQAFLSLIVDNEKKHESLLSKGTFIEKNLNTVFEKGDYFHYQLNQVVDVMNEEKYLLHAIEMQQKVGEMTNRLIKLIDPSDLQSYIAAIKGYDKSIISHRMEIYRQLSFLASLSIREIDVFAGNDTVYKNYDFDRIKNDYKGIKDQLEKLITDEMFTKLSNDEKDIISFLAKSELFEVKKFFENLDCKFDTTQTIIITNESIQ